MILTFLLDKKKNQTTNLPFLLVEVTDQLRIAYPFSLEIGKTGQQKKFLSACILLLYWQNHVNKFLIYSRKSLKLKVSIFSVCCMNPEHTLRFFWGVFHFHKHWCSCSFSGFLVDGKQWLRFGVIYSFFFCWINIRKYLSILRWDPVNCCLVLCSL